MWFLIYKIFDDNKNITHVYDIFLVTNQYFAKLIR